LLGLSSTFTGAFCNLLAVFHILLIFTDSVDFPQPS
jgi:hypothetical protein